MLKYIGKYSKAKILIDNVEESVVSQIYKLLNNPASTNSSIVVMPDTHYGNGCVVGLTMTIDKYIIPSVIGGDIGCGVVAYNLGKIDPKESALDDFIKNNIAFGTMINEKIYYKTKEFDNLTSRVGHNHQNVMKALGSLGGGNHFIELDKDYEDHIWLVIHTGSRSLGLAVEKYYSKKAKDYMKEIYSAGAYYKNEYLPIDTKSIGKEYIDDVFLTTQYASLNRFVIAKLIIENFYKKQINKLNKIESVHNYLGKDMILRKGAISAHIGEKLIIPINRAFGCLLCTGKSIDKYNFSAPHGAGRLLSRSEAKTKVSMEDYTTSMKNVFSSTVNKETIDESPMVYKSPTFIMENIKQLVEINEIIKPIYSFKSF